MRWGAGIGDQMAMADAISSGRCLGCLSCMTTCPSGVDYLHLVDIGRERLESTTSRPLADALVRWMLSHIVPHAGLFHLALLAGRGQSRSHFYCQSADSGHAALCA